MASASEHHLIMMLHRLSAKPRISDQDDQLER
jgi:hypothetical protein